MFWGIPFSSCILLYLLKFGEHPAISITKIKKNRLASPSSFFTDFQTVKHSGGGGATKSVEVVLGLVNPNSDSQNQMRIK